MKKKKLNSILKHLFSFILFSSFSSSFSFHFSRLPQQLFYIFLVRVHRTLRPFEALVLPNSREQTVPQSVLDLAETIMVLIPPPHAPPLRVVRRRQIAHVLQELLVFLEQLLRAFEAEIFEDDGVQVSWIGGVTLNRFLRVVSLNRVICVVSMPCCRFCRLKPLSLIVLIPARWLQITIEVGL